MAKAKPKVGCREGLMGRFNWHGSAIGWLSVSRRLSVLLLQVGYQSAFGYRVLFL